VWGGGLDGLEDGDTLRPSTLLNNNIHVLSRSAVAADPHRGRLCRSVRMSRLTWCLP
jgi:hypothetical protein